jgi:protein involved in polysaccharide export with SLBB domain
MVRSSDACRVLGLKSAAQAAVFGLACAALGAVVASYCWASLELDVAVSPRLIEGVKPASARKAVARGVNFDAGLGDVKRSESCCANDAECPSSLHGESATATCPHCALTKAKLACDGPFAVPFVPLHQRPDYRTHEPDILMVKIERLDAAGAAAELRSLSGEYLIDPGGWLKIGDSVKVQASGLTMGEIAAKIQQALDIDEAKHRIEVSVFSQNSHVYYVITEGAKLGDTVVRYPIAGNETALDALAKHGCLSQLAHRTVWIARPVPGNNSSVAPASAKWTSPDYKPSHQPAQADDSIIPVSWEWTSADTMTCTNPALQPGDRIFIASAPSWMAFVERAAVLAKYMQATRIRASTPEQPQTH